MEPDDTPRAPSDLLATVEREPLDRFSVDELEARIVRLEGEIARARAALSSKRGSLSDAEALFSKRR
ncbi:hypothetical protein CCR85_09530 [Rhodothalassium salexigens]|uniref:Uncharacterized protein DUF1192 n=1 Tax=Rhodothalassium salexigens DSM 2132 TaxID=1188247 RepID=A0A4R2PRK2_RHOSA|nr:DUF1192 domain-containing protein [Rhodothalassium salexigens]MBB4210295.1 uncharacterized small protein (DUF1192 family) [Rhodothalassium salexigens DSM 2132]MBK1639204.1 hypothetical protein [Rhodothalassium salexigens DSM 2132]MBK5911725.1 hypothetical protein [Rhodothalassium salexigens]MBK5920487.1 hypothetical protein [Rhodothalassium salexigens]TCP38459.1 uncharacterized protein DUF1192 [Rhodothalassium salexigens DSM 2132]